AADAAAVAKAVPGAAAGVRVAARLVLDEAVRLDPPLVLDYLALVDPSDFTEIDDDFTGEAVLAVAARVGATRLIDNLPLAFAADEAQAADQAQSTPEPHGTPGTLEAHRTQDTPEARTTPDASAPHATHATHETPGAAS
ncbi:pantoate--beta-alanine ligase, partial [Streptomyces sp. SID10815]|uniref:pantoate--beta-alanine ligase n=1 Tax=Streptomyces sp. SID10815 TaxID=2706027 RepID=UPI001EF1F73A